MLALMLIPTSPSPFIFTPPSPACPPKNILHEPCISSTLSSSPTLYTSRIKMSEPVSHTKRRRQSVCLTV